MSITLSSEEISSLTGLTQPAAQIRWLRARSWIYEVGADGLPKVASAYFEKRMVVGEPAASPCPSAGADDWQVNADALRRPAHNN